MKVVDLLRSVATAVDPSAIALASLALNALVLTLAAWLTRGEPRDGGSAP